MRALPVIIFELVQFIIEDYNPSYSTRPDGASLYMMAAAVVVPSSHETK